MLLVSIISLSSVEMTCCCFRGFFLGEAPGIRSPAAGALRVETCVVRAGADDEFALRSEGKSHTRCSLGGVCVCVCVLRFPCVPLFQQTNATVPGCEASMVSISCLIFKLGQAELAAQAAVLLAAG